MKSESLVKKESDVVSVPAFKKTPTFGVDASTVAGIKTEKVVSFKKEVSLKHHGKREPLVIKIIRIGSSFYLEDEEGKPINPPQTTAKSNLKVNTLVKSEETSTDANISPK